MQKTRKMKSSRMTTTREQVRSLIKCARLRLVALERRPSTFRKEVCSQRTRMKVMERMKTKARKTVSMRRTRKVITTSDLSYLIAT